MRRDEPLVSIITATYNRSNVLRYAIESVLDSTYANWEMIIVGDACTDDTETVVAGFGDPRLRFVNLETNVGEQSGPNNAGFALARGAYIAYLNHDDLFFPEHIEHMVAWLRKNEADLVYSGTILVRPPEATAKWRAGESYRFVPAQTASAYTPRVYAPASSWLLKREVIEAVGPWKSAYACYNESSQEFLFRAWKAGKKLVFKPEASVLAIQSGGRKGCYANREEGEHALYRHRMTSEPAFRRELMEQIALQALNELARPTGIGRCFRKKAVDLYYSSLIFMKINPRDVKSMLFRKRGDFIRHLREVRGLEPRERG